MNTTREVLEKNKSYNGWPNYETWIIVNWFNTEPEVLQGTPEAIKERITDIAWGNVRLDPSDAGFMGDIIRSFLSEVDWYHLSERFKE